MAAPKKSNQTTLQLSIEGGHKADQALLLYGSKTDLAVNLEMSRTTITNFFAMRGVEQKAFKKICRALKLKWEEVIEAEAQDSANVDTLVQQIRKAIRPQIQEQCGTMRVLDMDQPIELTGKNGIYTNVNILEKLTRLRSEQELRENCDFEVFDRFGLGRSVKRLPGLDAVRQHRRLMVLGKPGAGKTTFLKYLAMQCITGGFAADAVPMFVTLKDFAEAPKSPNLVDYLAQKIPDNQVELLLQNGRLLVLLDGLDEVREEDTKRVIREMRDFADRFEQSQVVITCRIAAKEYVFERFTEVEVADFAGKQIATFAENWFRAKNDLPKAKSFMTRLQQNKPIQELASSPLLLTLLCLVFGEGNDFPSNRADLYEEGVKILLKKWDAKRNIQRDELYKKLDVQRREDLLSYVALKTFQQKEYFIKQRRLEGYIADFIQNLKDVDPSPDVLRVDSEAVLKSIQAQHGLLVERARGIYSFSHLTFQEYFTAKEISAINKIDLLIPQMTEKRWREVFLLTVGMMRNADELLLAMKEEIDSMLADDVKLKQYLQWVNEKSLSVQTNYKISAVRAFYFALALDRDRDRDRDLDRDLDRALDRALDRDLALDRDRAFDRDRDLDLDRALDRDRAFDLDLARALARDPELKHQLQQVFDRLPDTSWENRNNFDKWWKTNGQQWQEDLRQIMIKYRNIGHDWQFTAAQKQRLQQYYDANLLLVECLNSEHYSNKDLRKEIEETILLPIEEIEKRRGKKEERRPD
jgi:predicted NACHT family NTPase